jgi:anti-anti-sigma factor
MDIQTEFTVVVDRDTPGLVRVAGELDLATAPELMSVLASRTGDVLLDCSDLAFIDGAGLQVVMKAHAECRRRGAQFVLLDPSPAVVRLLRLTDLDTVLPMSSRNGKRRAGDRDPG